MIKILYIHELKDFQAKSAQVESVYLIRELKQSLRWPFPEQKMEECFVHFLISELDLSSAKEALEYLPPTIQKIVNLLQERDPLYEEINLQRAIKILKETIPNLTSSLAYVQEMKDWQGSRLIPEVTTILNAIPKLRTEEEKLAYNGQLNQVFARLLRNQSFSFNFWDIVNEAQLSGIRDLAAGVARGYLFHISLEEEIQKINFENIKARIPKEKVALNQEIENDLKTICKGVERAYDVNMRMVNLALVLYSLVKGVNSGAFK